MELLVLSDKNYCKLTLVQDDAHYLSVLDFIHLLEFFIHFKFIFCVFFFFFGY